MEITIKINGQAVSVEVSYEVYEYLEESNRGMIKCDGGTPFNSVCRCT